MRNKSVQLLEKEWWALWKQRKMWTNSINKSVEPSIWESFLTFNKVSKDSIDKNYFLVFAFEIKKFIDTIIHNFGNVILLMDLYWMTTEHMELIWFPQRL